MDHGFTRSLPIQMIRPINNRFAVRILLLSSLFCENLLIQVHAEQAHLVHLHQPGQRRGRIEWTTDIIDEFQEMTREGTHLYARITNEPNTVDLMSYDSLTKKWFSFFEHFVKHINNNEEIEQQN